MYGMTNIALTLKKTMHVALTHGVMRRITSSTKTVLTVFFWLFHNMVSKVSFVAAFSPSAMLATMGVMSSFDKMDTFCCPNCGEANLKAPPIKTASMPTLHKNGVN